MKRGGNTDVSRRMGDNVILTMHRGLEKALENDKAVREEGRINPKKQ